MDEVLLQLSHVEHVFTPPSGKTLTVLADVQLTLRTGELVALLGPSGCGKSTLVRIAAGLLRPTQGEVCYRRQPVHEPIPQASLVFQQFALYPWLTIFQNIEQALIARGVPPEARRRRVSEVISLIGLDGFEEAYPREISGGMKQRVGMARALVVAPELLFMDEPFSQVDALTAETLRAEVVNFWRDREKYPQSILLVSHDIHEVAAIASRILIMSANPGRVKTVIENTLPYPRDARSKAYQVLVDRLHNAITGLYLPEEEPRPLLSSVPSSSVQITTMGPIPLVEVREMIGLLETVARRGGDVELFRLTTEMGRGFTRILLAVKASELLGFLETPQDRLLLTEFGQRFLAAPRKARRQLFQDQIVRLPLVKRLRDMLEHSPDHRVEKGILLEELAIQCPLEDPKRLFRILVNWGRYGELWFYESPPAALSMNGGGHFRTSPGIPGQASGSS